MIDDCAVLGVVAYGEGHQREETAHFIRSLMAHRTTPLHLIVIGDTTGIVTLFEVLRQKIIEFPRSSNDELTLWNMDVHETCLQIFSYIHPATKTRHPRLFVKLFTHEFFHHLSKVILLDSDLLVMDDIMNLWREFDDFGPNQLVSMSVDQSDGWYYRFQDPTDEYYSSGWAAVTNRVGVNGGVQLHHLENVRQRNESWTRTLVELTHTGARRSLIDLQVLRINQRVKPPQ